MPGEIRRLIREMRLANPLWGAPRIHGALLKLGVEIAQSTVGAQHSWVLDRREGEASVLRDHRAIKPGSDACRRSRWAGASVLLGRRCLNGLFIADVVLRSP